MGNIESGGFEKLNNVFEKTDEVPAPQEIQQETSSNQLSREDWVPVGEAMQKKKEHEGNERFLLKYEEALGRTKDEAFHFLNKNWR